MPDALGDRPMADEADRAVGDLAEALRIDGCSGQPRPARTSASKAGGAEASPGSGRWCARPRRWRWSRGGWQRRCRAARAASRSIVLTPRRACTSCNCGPQPSTSEVTGSSTWSSTVASASATRSVGIALRRPGGGERHPAPRRRHRVVPQPRAGVVVQHHLGAHRRAPVSEPPADARAAGRAGERSGGVHRSPPWVVPLARRRRRGTPLRPGRSMDRSWVQQPGPEADEVLDAIGGTVRRRHHAVGGDAPQTVGDRLLHVRVPGSPWRPIAWARSLGR